MCVKESGERESDTERERERGRAEIPRLRERDLAGELLREKH